MKPNELREKTIDELTAMLVDTKKALFDLRMKQVSGEAIDPHLFRSAKKDIARILTVMRSCRIVMDGGEDENDARKRLGEHNWDPRATLAATVLETVKNASGAPEDLAREALAARGSDSQLAIEAIILARAISPGSDADEKAVFTSFRRLRRDGFEDAPRFREAVEKLVAEKTGAEPKLLRMALADSNYRMDAAEKLVADAREVAEQSDTSAVRSMAALEKAHWNKKLAVARLKARASKIRRREQKHKEAANAG